MVSWNFESCAVITLTDEEVFCALVFFLAFLLKVTDRVKLTGGAEQQSEYPQMLSHSNFFIREDCWHVELKGHEAKKSNFKT